MIHLDEDLVKSFEDYPPVMKSAQVCEALAIGATRLRQLVKSGKIRAFTYEGSRPLRFTKTQVMYYVQKEQDNGGT